MASRRSRLTDVLIVSGILLVAMPAQAAETAPSPRDYHSMAYDSARGVIVLVGGNLSPSGQPDGETWEWDGCVWKKEHDEDPLGVDAPNPRYHASTAYDSAGGVTVLFGGYDRVTEFDDTWAWNGGTRTWSKEDDGDPPGPAPSPRYSHAMAYDGARGMTVLFGGWDGASLDGETWEWNGASWTLEHPEDPLGVDAPSARYEHAMAYDSARGVTVLFGGWDGAYDGETWEWDGDTWTKVHDGDPAGVTAPSPRMDHAMAYDSARGVTVLFGGFNDVFLGDTWEWDGTTWTRRDTTGLYVDADAPGPADGLTWATAFTNPQDALAVANPDDTIRVAEGTYMPDGGRIGDSGYVAGSGDRAATFQLLDGVTIEGGYAGFGEPDPCERDTIGQETILSGDLDNNDGPDFTNNGENSYNVVTGSGTDATAVLDGFLAEAGNANGPPENHGGGMYIGPDASGSSPTVTHCTFRRNNAGTGDGGSGGGAYIVSDLEPPARISGPRFVSCRFLGNQAGNGGGLYTGPGTTTTIVNCTFVGNYARELPGGAAAIAAPIRAGMVHIINCALTSNHAAGVDAGGVAYDTESPDKLVVSNCVLWGNTTQNGTVMDQAAQISPYHDAPPPDCTFNYNCAQGLTGSLGGLGNIGHDPEFVRNPDPGPDGTWDAVDDDYGDLRLRSGSPCIDAGDNAATLATGVTTDLDGNARFVDDPTSPDCPQAPGTCGTPPIVDMGAYEGPDCGSDTWTLKHPEDPNGITAPSPRFEHAMAYDSACGVTVLFGGIVTGPAYNGETWEWNGSESTWTQYDPDPRPSPRIDHGLAYDSARGVTVLFGGQASGSYNDETWKWNGCSNTWTQHEYDDDPVREPRPSPRHGYGMAYDSARGVIVLFGGNAGGATDGETWEWDGSVWTKVHDEDPLGIDAPSPRFRPAMAYDSACGVTVLFGGSTLQAEYFGDTWKWNGSTWTQHEYDDDPVRELRPSPRYYHAMAYDSASRVTVLFGGEDDAPGFNGETWAWKCDAWTILAPPEPLPSPRYGHAMAYDSARGVTVLFGGYDNTYDGETWEWGNPCPNDCNGNGVVDSIDISGGASPDCNANGLPDECEIDENSPAPGGPFFCDPASPTPGLDQCDPDCNDNGIPDECDIADCPAEPEDLACRDCNENGIPDGCDVPASAGCPQGTCEGDCWEDDNENCRPDWCEVRLIQICNNLGENLGLDCSRQCISPKSRHVPFDEVDVLIFAVAPIQVENATCSFVSTGGTPPADCEIEVIDAFLGEYRIVFKDGADQRVGIPVGEWTSVALTVQVADVSLTRDLHFDVGHLCGDSNMDGQLNLNDATYFGAVCPTGNPLVQVDLNDDGQCNLNDATLFGQCWNGTNCEGGGSDCEPTDPGGSIPWQGVGLPPQPPCPEP